MVTHCNSILQFLKPRISKSKTCFENLVPRSFRWLLDIVPNQTESNSKLIIKTFSNGKNNLAPKCLFNLAFVRITKIYNTLNIFHETLKPQILLIHGTRVRIEKLHQKKNQQATKNLDHQQMAPLNLTGPFRDDEKRRDSVALCPNQFAKPIELGKSRFKVAFEFL